MSGEFLPVLSPHQAAQAFSVSFKSSANMRQGLSRTVSDVFAYSGLGGALSDDFTKSEMTSELRRELKKKTAASRKKRQKSQTLKKGKRPPAKKSSQTVVAAQTKSSTKKSPAKVDNDVDDATSLNEPKTDVSATKNIEQEESKVESNTAVAAPNSGNEIAVVTESPVENSSEEVADESKVADKSESDQVDDVVAPLVVDDVQTKKPTLAVPRAKTTKSFNLKFSIDFTKVNFKRKYEEQQKKLAG